MVMRLIFGKNIRNFKLFGPVEISFKFKKIIISQIRNNELLTTVFEMQKLFSLKAKLK